MTGLRLLKVLLRSFPFPSHHYLKCELPLSMALIRLLISVFSLSVRSVLVSTTWVVLFLIKSLVKLRALLKISG